jgi:hypothetical protein
MSTEHVHYEDLEYGPTPPGAKYEHVMSAFAKTTEPAARKFAPSTTITETVKVLERQGLPKEREKAIKE